MEPKVVHMHFPAGHPFEHWSETSLVPSNLMCYHSGPWVELAEPTVGTSLLRPTSCEPQLFFFSIQQCIKEHSESLMAAHILLSLSRQCRVWWKTISVCLKATFAAFIVKKKLNFESVGSVQQRQAWCVNTGGGLTYEVLTSLNPTELWNCFFFSILIWFLRITEGYYL